MILNTLQFDTGILNGGFSLAPTLSTDLIVFDGFSLSNITDTITTYLDDSMPAREVKANKVPRDDGTFFISAYATEKTITVRGVAKASSADAMEALLDTMRKKVWGKEKYLDITKPTSRIRRYVASLDNPSSVFSQRQGSDITKVPFELVFKARNPPFAKDRDYTSVTIPFTTSPTNQAVTNIGSEKSRPVITLIFDAATAITSATITNTTNGDSIQYLASIVANDILEFDSENKTVKKNGVQVDFKGSFIRMEPDTNTLSFTIAGTSFSVNATIAYKATYL